MRIAFLIDPPESFKIYKDSTYAMMREAAGRGHELHVLQQENLAWHSGRVSAATDETLYGSICASVAAGSSGTRAALSPKSRPMESISAAMVGCRWKCLWALT